MTDLITRAEEFAKWVHRHQKRKYTNEPYFLHCKHVADIVTSQAEDATRAMIAAAYLHDCVEDQEVTPELLRALFGDEVTQLVLEVTDISKPSDGNREVRKALDRQHLSKASPAGKTIKYADLISNTSSIVQHDQKFAVTYLREKRLLLPMIEGGDPKLYQMAKELSDVQV